MLRIKVLTILFLFYIASASLLYANDSVLRGTIDFYGAADANNGDIYRQQIGADIILQKKFYNTEFYFDIRTEYDSVRSPEELIYNDKLASDDQIPNKRMADTEQEDAQQRVFIKEAYITQHIYFDEIGWLESFHMKFGKLIYNWGVSLEDKPCDILNPQDYSFFTMKSRDERKNGVYSATASLYITENIYFNGLVIPVFEENQYGSEYFVAKKYQELAADDSLHELSYSETPEKNMKNANYAAQLGVKLFDIAMHAQYYHGRDTSPTFIYSQYDASHYNISIEYQEIDMYGFDIKSPLAWGISIFGEIAYYSRGKYFLYDDADIVTTTPTSYTARENNIYVNSGNGNLEKKYTTYAIGLEDIDFLGLDDLHLLLQFNQRVIVGYDTEEHLSDPKRNNKLLARCEYSFFHQKIKLMSFTTYNITEKDLGQQLEVRYRFGEVFDLFIGGWIFRADDEENPEGEYGQFDTQDFIYVGGEITF